MDNEETLTLAGAIGASALFSTQSLRLCSYFNTRSLKHDVPVCPDTAPRKDHVTGKRIPKTVAPTASFAVFMTAAGVVIRQRHGFKDQKTAHKAHAGKQLFPEVHSSHLARLQHRIQLLFAFYLSTDIDNISMMKSIFIGHSI